MVLVLCIWPHGVQDGGGQQPGERRCWQGHPGAPAMMVRPSCPTPRLSVTSPAPHCISSALLLLRTLCPGTLEPNPSREGGGLDARPAEASWSWNSSGSGTWVWICGSTLVDVLLHCRPHHCPHTPSRVLPVPWPGIPRSCFSDHRLQWFQNSASQFLELIP